jgi:hypothetical protein
MESGKHRIPSRQGIASEQRVSTRTDLSLERSRALREEMGKTNALRTRIVWIPTLG